MAGRRRERSEQWSMGSAGGATLRSCFHAGAEGRGGGCMVGRRRERSEQRSVGSAGGATLRSCFHAGGDGRGGSWMAGRHLFAVSTQTPNSPTVVESFLSESHAFNTFTVRSCLENLIFLNRCMLTSRLASFE